VSNQCSDLFDEVVKSVRCNIEETDLKYEKDPCSDNYVGYFDAEIENENKNGKLRFLPELRERYGSENHLTNKKLKNITEDEKKIIVIVLESPHVQEYEVDKYSIAPAPALGLTGQNLNDYFIDLIRGEIDEGNYHVILMNAVQYQCSLGVNTKRFRDRIFLSMWSEKTIRDDFTKRLKKYKPDIIINLCTKGSHQLDLLAPPKSKTVINETYLKSINDEHKYFDGITNTTLQKEIQYCINKCYQERSMKVTKFSGSHPSCWNMKKHRNIVKMDK